MGLISRYYTFSDGKNAAGLITADRLNGNFDEVYDEVNGELDEANVATDATVLCADRNYTGADKITGNFEFDDCPVVPAASIADSYLSANVPLLDAAQEFTAKQTLSGGLDMDLVHIENLIVEKVAALPAWDVSYKGRVVYCTGDNTFYGANDSTWKVLDYTGGYTGGAVRSYSEEDIVDASDSMKFWFKTEGATPTVKIALMGLPYPKRFYIELPYHTHVFSGTSHGHTATQVAHAHVTDIGVHDHGTKSYALSTHTHGISGNTAVQSADHTHLVSGSTSGTTTLFTTGGLSHTHPVSITSATQSANHTHAISLTTGTPSASDNVDNETIGNKTSDSQTPAITVVGTASAGTNANSGVNIGASLSSAQKLYGKSLAVKIDGTSVTSDILTATGWSAIGDGTGTHAFHVAGTGEMTASAWVSYAAGFHTLAIFEPEAGYGCSVLVHIETS